MLLDLTAENVLPQNVTLQKVSPIPAHLAFNLIRSPGCYSVESLGI